MDRANEVVRRPRAATIRESERIVVEWRRSGESSTGMEQLTDNPNVPQFGVTGSHIIDCRLIT